MKAGQKVIVLKSHKGICLQLESGKVIAIRASMKGSQAPGVEQKLGSFSGLQNPQHSSGFRPNFPPRNDGDVIDISNDDDEDEGEASQAGNVKPIENTPVVPQASHLLKTPLLPTIQPPSSPTDTVYKEKVVYKPNLVQRKSKMPPPPTPAHENSSGFQPRRGATPPKWEERKNYANSAVSTTSNYTSRNGNGGSKNPFSNCKKQILIFQKFINS